MRFTSGCIGVASTHETAMDGLFERGLDGEFARGDLRWMWGWWGGEQSRWGRIFGRRGRYDHRGWGRDDWSRRDWTGGLAYPIDSKL